MREKTSTRACPGNNAIETDNSSSKPVIGDRKNIHSQGDASDEKWIKDVKINSVSSSYSRSLGSELVGHHVWQQLEFSSILKSCGFSGRERSLSEGVVVGRLIYPRSDLKTWKWLRNYSALPELTEVAIEKVTKDEVYKIADRLLEKKTVLEEHLLQREKELFPDRDTLYLLDLTNFYLEGQALNNVLAHRAKSKEKRDDCPLVSLALVVDQDGFPVVSRIYEGNVSEPGTLEQILKDMGYLNQKEQQLQLPTMKPTMVMDRGIATIDNLDLLRDNQFPFIVIERAPRHEEYGHYFVDYKTTFEKITRKGGDVWIRKIPGKQEKTSLVLCMSEGRKAKETAMANRWESRAKDDLKRLQSSILKGNIKAIEKVYQRLGRIKERYPGFRKRFAETVHSNHEKTKAIQLSWKMIEAKEEKEEKELHGCYVIETDYIDKEANDIWHLYMTLTRVEAAFRSLKSDLGTRPIFHQLAHRVQAHLFIAVLAYHLLITIEYQMAQKQDHRRWDSIRDCLKNHSRNTIILTDEKNVIHHIRVSADPEPAHLDIYQKLNIKNPLPRIHYEVARIVEKENIVT